MMSSSPVAEPSSPSITTPPSPALQGPSRNYSASTLTPFGNTHVVKKNHPPLNVILPSAPGTPSTFGEPTLTPPPRSPGTVTTPASGDARYHAHDGTSSDKSSETAVGIPRTTSTALSRKESYKAQRQHYRREKKRAASALLHSIEDPAVVVLADWLKVRGSLKSWTKLWCVLKPGLLLLYKSPKAKSSHWVGTVLLTSCQVIERPSKKDGFCFKLYHPLEQSIWAPRGPHNETIGAVVQPLPTAHLIFRAPSQAAGHCWLDGLELALRCSNAMLRCSRSRPEQAATDAPATQTNISHEELEKHFNEHAMSHCRSPTPLMSVSDYSPKRNSSSERKVSYQMSKKPKPTRKISKWAQFVESIEMSSKDNDISSDETPESDKKEHGFLDFLRKKDTFERNSEFTSSARIINEPKVVSNTSKSLASSPLKIESITKRAPILKCFEMPKLPLSLGDRFRDKSVSPVNVIEDNLVRFMTTFPKRRSSTPGMIKSMLTQKKISELRESGVKTDSENDDFLKCALPKKMKVKGSSELLCATPENFIITKTAPSVERFRKYSSSSTDDVFDASFRRNTKSPSYLTQTPDKYSLIDYHNLPSASYEAGKLERKDDRLCSQSVYVAGSVVTGELAGAASDTDSETSRSGMPSAQSPAVDRKQDILARIGRVYIEDPNRDVGAAGELVEEVAEENKSLLWFLLKQVRPGMDLSKVVLPTFILEPRSFLDKLSDSYYHADILALAQDIEDPYQRFKCVLRWYLSGFYRKPKGLKKPYNPVLGEVFRCCWKHPKSDTYTYYVAEQVSHHPPMSAFYVSNRKEGFVIEGSLSARSKFYGNSTSAILEGCARLHLVKWGETYITTAPYAHCKGIVIGTLSMELGGKIHVMCINTGYHADVEFKLRSFLGGSDSTNAISGRIKKGKETIASLEGYWDGKIDIKDKRNGDESVLLDVALLKEQRLCRYLMKVDSQIDTESQRLWLKDESVLLDVALLKEQRLCRYLMKVDNQIDTESQRLWLKVSEAIANEDQIAATEQKTIIEEAQRVRARASTGSWVPRFFHKDLHVMPPDGIVDNGWKYKHSNTNAWQPQEVIEYEDDFVIQSLTDGSPGRAAEPPRRLTTHRGSDSDSREDIQRRSKTSTRTLKQTLVALDTALRDQTTAIERLSKTVDAISEGQRAAAAFRPQNVGRLPTPASSWDLFCGFILALVLQALLNWIFYHKD